MIMPGIADFETVQRWHCPRFLESPLATNGVVDGNPVHEESMAIAKMMPQHFIVDVTLSGANVITGVFAGDMELAWREGVAFAANHLKAPIEALADIVVTSSAGFPLDLTFYQTVKGMVGAMPAVKRGGTIIIVSACTEGIGSPAFTKTLLEAGELQAFVERISAPDVFEPEEWQVEELAKASRHAEIVLVTDGLSANVVSSCHVRPASSFDAALHYAYSKHGADASIIAIPRGPYVIPACVQKS